MKMLAKIVFIGTLGAGATLLAAPDDNVRGMQLQMQLKSDYQIMQRLQAAVRKDRDVIKLNCVNDKIVQAAAEMNIADTSLRALEASSDQSGRDSAMTSLAGSVETVRKLREDASLCLDSKTLTIESSNTFDTGGVNPIEPTPQPDPGIEPPVYASPTGDMSM